MPVSCNPRPWWHPDILADRMPFLRRRQHMLAELRGWFTGAGFIEVETPALQISPGMEPHLQAFATRLVGPRGDSQTMYLHTSPEFAMKKLLAGGLPRIVQFARVWRNGEGASTHSPEFTMLEWYRAGCDYRQLMADCEDLLRVASGDQAIRWRGQACALDAPFQRLSVADAFTQFIGIDLLATAPNPLLPDVALLATALAAVGRSVREGEGWEDIVLRLLGEEIEPKLGQECPTFLFDYPISMAALSRPKPSDPRVAERFELYVCGLELANAFSELTDAAEQRRRFHADMDLKQRLYGERYPVDEDFLAALDFGLPACAGIALGVDRLAMLVSGADRIDQVLWAPVAMP